jgi:predicted RNase H-like HicB family nuclease
MKKFKEVICEYNVVFDPNGSGYTVTVPQLPGLVTEGDTLKEAREMAKDAICCYLEALLKDEKDAMFYFGKMNLGHARVAVTF